MAPVTMPTPEVDFTKSTENCITDGLAKLGGGLAVGTVLSLFLLKRRRWPIILGGGVGLGAAWSNCAKSLNTLTSSHKPSPKVSKAE